MPDRPAAGKKPQRVRVKLEVRGPEKRGRIAFFEMDEEFDCRLEPADVFSEVYAWLQSIKGGKQMTAKYRVGG